jgi:hypothetical protein
MPDPLRNMFPVGRLSGANIEVSGAPVMSKLLVGLTAFGGFAEACAHSGAVNAAASVSAAMDRTMNMVRSGYGKRRPRQLCSNQAVSNRRARTTPANVL